MRKSPLLNIAEALKRKNPQTELISLDSFLLSTTEQPRPRPFKIEKKPAKDTLILKPPESFKELRPSIDNILNKINPKQKSTANELARLEELKKWKNSLSKDPIQKQKIPAKRPRAPEKAIIEVRETFSIHAFIDGEIAKKQKEKERLSHVSKITRDLTEMAHSNSVNDHTQELLSTELIKQKERNLRFQKKSDTSEFYNFLFDINPFNLKYPISTVKIPHTFTDGAEYIHSFRPCFFNELGAYIELALAKTDFIKTATIQATIKTIKDEYTWLNISEDAQDYSFYANFHTDDLVLMYPSNEKVHSYREWKESNQVGFLAVCEKVGPVKLLRVKNESSFYFTRKNSFQVTFVEKVTTAFREFRMIREAEFLQLGDLIINPSNTQATQHIQVPPAFFRSIETYYNTSQISAIQDICEKPNGISLLQGPPGTGKTHTLLGILSAFMFAAAKSNSQILVCAPSNAAVNEIVNRVLKNGLYSLRGPTSQFNCVRIGSLAPEFSAKHTEQLEVSEEVRSVSLSTLLSKKLKEEGVTDSNVAVRDIQSKLAKVENQISLCTDKTDSQSLQDERKRLLGLLTKEYHNKDRTFDKKLFYKKQILENAHIIFCTLSTSGCTEMQELARNFDYVIIDEACQSIELSTLIPLQYYAKHVVLIGDPMQLPATTFAGSSSSTLYNLSLFERLAEAGAGVRCLEVQYRMAQEICDFSSVHFYNSRLEPAAEVRDRAVPGWLPSPSLAFIDYNNSSEARAGKETSVFNKGEADFVGGLVEFILNRDECFKSIGVITPYRKQVDVIRNALRKKGLKLGNGVEVDTVDGFQGREKDLIVFSCVRTSGIGFLADFRRLNVAVTRAKFGLFMIGCSQLLGKNTHWASFINYLQQRNSLVRTQSLDQFLSLLSWNQPSGGEVMHHQNTSQQSSLINKSFQPTQMYERKKESDDKMMLDLVNDIIYRRS